MKAPRPAYDGVMSEFFRDVRAAAPLGLRDAIDPAQGRG
jgi:hypothetical protein